MSTVGTIGRRVLITGTDNPAYQVSKNVGNDTLVVTTAAPNGTAMVRDSAQTDGWGFEAPQFLQAGTGATARTVDSRLKDTISVKDFGAVGDGVTDDRAAIQATITAAEALGGALGGATVLLPSGTYKVLKNGSTDRLFTITTSVHVVGYGATIAPDNAMDVDVFLIVPSGVDTKRITLEGFRVPLATNSRDIVRVNVWDGHGLYWLDVFRCHLFSGLGYAVNLRNGFDASNAAAAINTNGVYLSRVGYGTLYGGLGGLKGYKLGDTNQIVFNDITGPGRGIDISMLASTDSGGHSAMQRIVHNSITSDGGAIKIVDGNLVEIAYNNIESPLAGAAAGVIDYAGESSTFSLGYGLIAKNKITINGDTNGIVADDVRGLLVRDNYFSMNAGTRSAISLLATGEAVVSGNTVKSIVNGVAVTLSSSSVNTVLGPLIVNNTAGTKTVKYVDAGVGTQYCDPFYGLDQVTNGGFATDTNWNKGTGWTIAGAVAVATAVAAGQALSQAVGVIAGRSYCVTFTCIVTSGQVRFALESEGTGVGTNRAASGTYTETVVAADSGNLYFQRMVADFTGTIDNVSLREVPASPVRREAVVYSGTGTPEGSVVAFVGNLYVNLAGGSATTLYVKETGAGNTGWIAK